jgi:hypothetical protein
LAFELVCGDWQITFEKPQKFLDTLQGVTTDEGETCFTHYRNEGI